MNYFVIISNTLRKIPLKRKTYVFVTFFIVFTLIKRLQKESLDSSFCEKIYTNNEELYFVSHNISEIKREYSFDYSTMFKCYNLNATRFFDMPFVSVIRGERNVFQSVAKHIYSNINLKNLESKNVECGDIIYIQTENLKLFAEEFHPEILFPYILITHESDLSVGEPWHLEFLDDPKIIMWYTVNIAGNHPKLKPLPIGLIPPSRKNFSILYELSHNLIPSFERSNLLYLNFRPETNENRSAVYNFFKNNFDSNSKVFIDEIRSDWKTYLSRIANSKFVVSPPGTGLDCHRTWESLALGSVPIVLNNTLLPLYDGLPVMVVNDWTEVTEESMKQFQRNLLPKFSKDGFAWKPKFWLRYWISNIMNVKRDYINKHC